MGCTYTLKMQNYPFLSNPWLYIDNVLQRQVRGQDMLVGGLAVEGRAGRLLPTLTVHPGLLQFLQLVGCERRAPFVEQDQQLWGHT